MDLWSRARRRFYMLVDERCRREQAGERVLFTALRERLPVRGRILEVGPKHGEDSRLLATLDPAELVLVDIPEKRALVDTWLQTIPGCVTYLDANILAVEDDVLGRFDLVWCCGVLYHNVEQVRLLRRLARLAAPGATLVLESATARRVPRLERSVEVWWPPYRDAATITHLPGREAIAAWLWMVG